MTAAEALVADLRTVADPVAYPLTHYRGGGGWLRDRPRDVLFELASSSDPLRRRTAMTAPLYYTRPAHPGGLGDLYRLAALLLDDPDPLVSKPVGIALKHAGAVDPGGVRAFLAKHGDRVPRPIARAAREKLPG